MFGLFRKKPAQVACCSVTFMPGQTVLQLRQGDNLLTAALKQGIAAPYNCRVGACKTCQVRVLAGQPTSLIEREYVFSQQEIADGAYLACQTLVRSDMTVAWHGTARVAPVRGVAQLADVRRMTPRVSRVQLRLDAPLTWRAGQFARLAPAGLDAQPRCYSMVAPGDDTSLMTFDITHYPDGAVSPWLTDAANVGKPVFVEAPFGDFGIDPATSDAALLCIAGGSGIGAIGGIIASHARHAGALAPVLLVYGARDASERYGLDELRNLAERAGVALRIDVVLDREPADSRWEGRRGYVAAELPRILADAAAADPRFHQPGDAWRVLLCGPSVLVDTAIGALQQCGVQPRQMAFDKYEQNAA